MTAGPNSFVWYELMSTDVPAAKAFYGAVVGWTLQDIPMPGMIYTLLRVGEVQVAGLMALPQAAFDAGMKPFWGAYIGVDDVDAAAAQAQRLGGTMLRPPEEIPGVGRYAVMADPTGAAFNLYKALQPGQPVASTAPGFVGWRELHTQGWPKAFDFYSALFGWGKGDSIDMQALGTYQLFTINGLAEGAMFNSPAAQFAQFWLPYFNVEDIDTAALRVTDGGGQIMHGPVQVPGGGWIVQAADPQGAAFALLGSRP